MNENKKKRVGIFSFTCDEGCSIFLIEIFNKKLVEWLEKIELAYFLSVKDDREIDHFDIALIEGVISSEDEKTLIEKIRSKTDTLIAMGSCAATGLPSGQRNLFNEEKKERIAADLKKFHHLPKCLSVKEAVKVDDEVMGCPINETKFIEVFEKYI
jgi:coenzyme F420-reducing hydrogenase gamma subunit